MQSSEMTILRSIEGCSILDKIKNEEIRKELRIESLKNNAIQSGFATMKEN